MRQNASLLRYCTQHIVGGVAVTVVTIRVTVAVVIGTPVGLTRDVCTSTQIPMVIIVQMITENVCIEEEVIIITFNTQPT